MRRALVLSAALVVSTVAGCATSEIPAAVTVTPAAPGTPVAPAAATRPGPSVSCTAVRASRVFGSQAPYAEHPQGLQLYRGRWQSGEEMVLAEEPCATGKLENLDATATIGTLTWRTHGSTGRWWALTLCTPGGQPAKCVVQDILDDREPIKSVTIGGGEATVVYMTRTGELPNAGINVRRTAKYRYHVNGLVQTSYTDVVLTQD